MKEVVVYESYIYISKVYFVGEETIEIFQSGQLKSWGQLKNEDDDDDDDGDAVDPAESKFSKGNVELIWNGCRLCGALTPLFPPPPLILRHY